MRFTSHQDIFRRLDKVASYATLSHEERRQYDYDLKKARDYHAELAYARKAAITEGRKEGRAEEKFETAKKVLELGLATENIMHVTGLTAEQLASLK